LKRQSLEDTSCTIHAQAESSCQGKQNSSNIMQESFRLDQNTYKTFKKQYESYLQRKK